MTRVGGSASSIKDATGGRGVDVVIDIVGGTYVACNISILAAGGRHVSLSFWKARRRRSISVR